MEPWNPQLNLQFRQRCTCCPLYTVKCLRFMAAGSLRVPQSFSSATSCRCLQQQPTRIACIPAQRPAHLRHRRHRPPRHEANWGSPTRPTPHHHPAGGAATHTCIVCIIMHCCRAVEGATEYLRQHDSTCVGQAAVWFGVLGALSSDGTCHSRTASLTCSMPRHTA